MEQRAGVKPPTLIFQESTCEQWFVHMSSVFFLYIRIRYSCMAMEETPAAEETIQICNLCVVLSSVCLSVFFMYVMQETILEPKPGYLERD